MTKYRDLYKTYTKYYNKAKSQLKKYGRVIEDMYTRREFALMYDALRSDLKGTSKASNINRELINRQKYILSERQALTIQRAIYDAYGDAPTIMELRINGYDFTEFENYAAMMGGTVGQILFGSP